MHTGSLLPRHSQDLAVSPVKIKKCKSKKMRKMVQLVGSFAVTWLFLNALFGNHTPSISGVRQSLSSTMTRFTSHLTNEESHSGVLALRPLSVEAQSIRDRCKSLPPLPKDVYRNRISKVRQILQEIHQDTSTGPTASASSGEIYIMEPGPSSLYYTGAGSHEWHTSERPFLFLIRNQADEKSKTVLSILTPAFEASRAKALGFPGLDKDQEVDFIEWKEEENWADVLVRYLTKGTEAARSDKSTLKLHFDPAVRSFISAGIAHALVGLDNNVRISMDVADPRVLSVRERKSSEEVAVLKCANEVSPLPR